jgi:hypothetical protein
MVLTGYSRRDPALTTASRSYPTRVSVPELKATQILNIKIACEKCALVEKLLEPKYCIYGRLVAWGACVCARCPNSFPIWWRSWIKKGTCESIKSGSVFAMLLSLNMPSLFPLSRCLCFMRKFRSGLQDFRVVIKALQLLHDFTGIQL